MGVLLINKNNIGEFKALSNGVDISKIEQYIEAAQEFDLKEIICREFYFDILKNYQEDKYQKLIHGDTYDDGDMTVEFKGLKPVIAFFAYARYILFGNVQDTGFGFVQKTNEFSEPIQEKQKKDMRTLAIQDAMKYWKECLLYLNKKVVDFPVWKKCTESCNKNGRSLNISRIG